MVDDAFLIDTNILVYYLDATLVTRNTQDFEGMSVPLYDPFDLSSS